MNRLKFLVTDKILSLTLKCLTNIASICRLKDSKYIKILVKYFIKKRINNILLNCGD